MKRLIVLATLLFAKISSAAPAERQERIITKEMYKDFLVKYRSNHDIVSIVTSIGLHTPSNSETCCTFFFVEADEDDIGNLIYQGLYVFKDDKATKLLDNGRDIAVSIYNVELLGKETDDVSNNITTQIFFAAQDGLYEYKPDTKEIMKYGSVNDSIISIAITNTNNVIYILTENHELYMVTDAGNTKIKVDEVVDAQEFVLDYSNNIYFYGQNKKPRVLTVTGVKDIEGLPANPTKVNLFKPPIIIEDGVLFIVDNTAYIIYANGSSEYTGCKFFPGAAPTAYSMDATMLQYYAYKKQIYEFNILAQIGKALQVAINRLFSYLQS